jgi:hypothetical protein
MRSTLQLLTARVSLRVLRRPRQAVYLHLLDHHPLPEAHLPPLLDRIDIHVEVPRVEYEKLSDNRVGETSAAIRARVEAARKRQRERFAHVEGVSCNSGGSGYLPGGAPTPRHFPQSKQGC